MDAEQKETQETEKRRKCIWVGWAAVGTGVSASIFSGFISQMDIVRQRAQ